MATNDYEEFAGLVRRYREGDNEAFEKIYEKTSRGVYATCLGVLADPEDAEDAMQETYISVLGNIDSLDKDKTLVAWINRIAVNKSLDIVRKRKGDVRYDEAAMEDEITEDGPDNIPEYYITEQSKRDTLNGILRSELSDVQYRTVFLYYYDEMSVEEISSVMDCPEGTVKTRLKSSRALIRRAVEQYERESNDSLEPAAASVSLSRYFAAFAGALAVPPAAAILGAVTGAVIPSAVAAAGARTVAAKSASGAAAKGAAKAAGSAAARTGFFTTAAGKAVIVAAAAAVVIPAGIGVAYLVNSSRAEEPEETTEEVFESETEESAGMPWTEPVVTETAETRETQPAMADVALTDLPDYDKLKSFISRWSYHEYDHDNVPDDFVLNKFLITDAGLLVDIASYYPDYDAYAEYDDPQGLFAGIPGYRVGEDQLMWIEENILNISAEDIARINGNVATSTDGTYYSGGYFADGYLWYTRGWGGYSICETVIAAQTDGKYYYITSVEYDDLAMENDPGYNPLKDGQRYDYVMEYKDIGGAYYWTILSCGISSSVYTEGDDMSMFLPEAFSCPDTGWKTAYAGIVQNIKPEDFDNGYNEGSYQEILCDLVFINDDDIPELILSVDVDGYVRWGKLYTFTGGEAVLLKSLYGYEDCYNTYEPRGNCIVTGGGIEENGGWTGTYIGHMTDDLMSLDNLSLVKSNYDMLQYGSVYEDPNAYSTVRYYYFDPVTSQKVEISEEEYYSYLPDETVQPLKGTMSTDYFLEALGV